VVQDGPGDPDDLRDLCDLVARVPPGWTRVVHGGRAWGLSRTDHVGGRSVFVEADELGGPGRLSANVWFTADGPLLRPCEVPADEVLGLLRGWVPA
jgi:peptide-methionine (S)-S-oxide reductase